MWRVQQAAYCYFRSPARAIHRKWYCKHELWTPQLSTTLRMRGWQADTIRRWLSNIFRCHVAELARQYYVQVTISIKKRVGLPVSWNYRAISHLVIPWKYTLFYFNLTWRNIREMLRRSTFHRDKIPLFSELQIELQSVVRRLSTFTLTSRRERLMIILALSNPWTPRILIIQRVNLRILKSDFDILCIWDTIYKLANVNHTREFSTRGQDERQRKKEKKCN